VIFKPNLAEWRTLHGGRNPYTKRIRNKPLLLTAEVNDVHVNRSFLAIEGGMLCALTLRHN